MSVNNQPFFFTNVTLFRLKKILSAIGFFFFIFFINLPFTNIKNLPVLWAVIVVVSSSVFISVFEFFIAGFLQKKLHTFFFLLVSLTYYYSLFFLLVLVITLSGYEFDTFVSFEKLISFSFLKVNYDNISFLFVYLSIFFATRFLFIQLQTRTLYGAVRRFLWNKPGKPKADERIFMFMDLISSTTYAEKLGYMKYSMFIADIYKELDEFVLETRGEIYQYVGDEVVIVWSMLNGTEKLNCVRFFALINRRLEIQKKYFLENYGIFPRFKAGFHYGKVAITEIGGMMRKDIAFHGDPVNTTARLCTKCTDLKETILISRDLVNKFQLNDLENLFIPKGFYQLRGKNKKIELMAVNRDSLDKFLVS